MRRRLTLIAVCVATPLAAQPATAPAAPIAPAALAAARRVLVASDLSNTMRAIAPQIAEAAMSSVRGMFIQGDGPEGLIQRLQEVMRREAPALMDVYTPEMVDQVAAVYARHFSVAELDRIADLMGDPAMVRFRRQTPAVMHDMMPVILAAMAPRQAAFQKAVRQAVVDWIRDHPQDKARLAKPLAT